ncbi:MAG TPA: hypothetical protein VHE61_15665 [Opitutaceae bacterium]|nr:hypothetical protein [Opitutaceae bacterium]
MVTPKVEDVLVALEQSPTGATTEQLAEALNLPKGDAQLRYLLDELVENGRVLSDGAPAPHFWLARWPTAGAPAVGIRPAEL